jgi:hypothetical protein
MWHPEMLLACLILPQNISFAPPPDPQKQKKSRRRSLLTINLELHLKGGNPQPPN